MRIAMISCPFSYALVAGFGFDSRSHNIANRFADCQDRTIWFGIRNFWWRWRSIAQDLVTGIGTLGIRENKIGCIHVSIESHVACMVADNGQRLSCSIAEYIVKAFFVFGVGKAWEPLISLIAGSIVASRA
jgi:hypothetical protein